MTSGTDESSIADMADIVRDLEAADRGRARMEPFFAQEIPRFRGAPAGGPPAAAASDAGRTLLDRCGSQTRQRFATLLHFERGFPGGDDCGCLIVLACQLLEVELDRVVATPSRTIAVRLASALAMKAKGHKQAEILERWHAGEVPTTIGIESLLLLALRRGCEQQDPVVIEFIETRFRPRYLELLRTKTLGASVDHIRDRYRNPACHGTASFDESGYSDFVRLMVARERFSAWHAEGPARSADPGAGVFHHHLAESRSDAGGRAGDERTLQAPSEVGRLIAVARGAKHSRLALSIAVERADAPQFRSITVVEAKTPAFRSGDSVRFVFRAEAPCHATLLGVGTSGVVSVILPNAWLPRARISAGEVHTVPERTHSDFEFILAGTPGLERVIAIGTEAPLPVPLEPDVGAGFRTLASREVERLVAALEGLEPDAFGAGVCEFVVGETT